MTTIEMWENRDGIFSGYVLGEQSYFIEGIKPDFVDWTNMKIYCGKVAFQLGESRDDILRYSCEDEGEISWPN